MLPLHGAWATEASIASDISIIQAQGDRSTLSPLMIAWNICTSWFCYPIDNSDLKVERGGDFLSRQPGTKI